jgi:hypothetical protein
MNQRSSRGRSARQSQRAPHRSRSARDDAQRECVAEQRDDSRAEQQPSRTRNQLALSTSPRWQSCSATGPTYGRRSPERSGPPGPGASGGLAAAQPLAEPRRAVLSGKPARRCRSCVFRASPQGTKTGSAAVAGPEHRSTSRWSREPSTTQQRLRARKRPEEHDLCARLRL